MSNQSRTPRPFARLTNPLPQLVPQRFVRVKQIVDGLAWERSEDLEVFGGRATATQVPYAKGVRQPMRRVRPGDTFGKPWGSWGQRWMRVRVPAPRPGERGRRHLRWECPGEATVWIDGKPWAGLDPGHGTCPLPDRAATLMIDSSLWQSMGGDWSIGRFGLRFVGASLRVRNEAAWEAKWDLAVLESYMNFLMGDLGSAYSFGFRKTLESAPPRFRRLLRLLDLACDAWDAGGLPALAPALKRVYREFPAESYQPGGALVGHAHLDQVWLWPESASEHKAVHTAANQLRLMERYPEYVFSQSQASQYRMVERLAPSQAREIRARIRSGQWEATGVFEVESDTNLPCGESLARQTRVGQGKFAELLGGKLSRVCWIPDVFGYSGCLPQILALGGARYFFTTKMTWSQITKFPYSSFVWRGLDGTEIVTHLCSTTYNGDVSIQNNVTALNEHRQSDVHPEMLLPTGWGDGGGGVTEEMIERARRTANLAGVPRTTWTTAEEFFRRLDRVRGDLPVYQGELYLEYHRGTYTTQGEYKRRHRALERALQAHEAVRVALGRGPVDEKDWQRLLFGEFHDALPGSSIGIVYRQLGGELEARGKTVLDRATAELSAGRRGAGWNVFNPVAIPRRAVVDIPGRWEPVLVALAGLEGKSVADAERGGPGTIREATAQVLDNGALRAEFGAHGHLVGMWVDGEPLAIEGAGFSTYHDDPHGCDAWDIDHGVLRHPRFEANRVDLKLVERNAFRATLEGSTPLGKKSRMTVRYILDAACPHLKIEVAVDWHESHRLLKYNVQTGYRGRRAVFGTPFGSIDRPQQPGTEREEAMWEVPGSRWAAVLRDDGTGLAVVTEAKYGFSCRDGNLGLSLLRSPKGPDGTADMGVHRIRFALGRFEPSTGEGVLSTAACAEALYAPVLVTRGAAVKPPFAIEEPGSLVASWVLPCAESKGFVIRLHETAGSPGTAVLRLARPRQVDLVDFLERPIGRVRHRPDGSFALEYRPYQILSVRVR
ncbi:MAG: glycoside hydrolase family 38 C-terminal domain-containing protein [Candidatus Coatesbacteria bacterium]